MNTNNKNRAFTLIELLVVISIIALLLSILMPSLQKVKAAGRNIVCRSNMKNIVTAAHLWSYDNEGWSMPASWDRETSSGDPMIQKYLEAGAADGVMNCPNMKQFAGKTYGDLGFTDAECEAMNAKSHNFVNSYGYNLKLCGKTNGCPGRYNGSNHDGSQWGKNNVWWATHGNCKLDTIDKAGKKIMFAESFHYLAYPEIYLPNSPSSGIMLKDTADRGLRHNPKNRRIGPGWAYPDQAGTMNIAWCDGSVSTSPDNLEYKDEGEFLYKMNGGYWYGNHSYNR